MDSGISGLTDVADARALFPGAANGPYMDVSRRGLLSAPARAAIDGFLDDQMAGRDNKAAWFETVERARTRYAKLIGAEADEIAVTKNVSEGLNAVIAALPWATGDNVVYCQDLEHPNNVYPWRNVARRFGVELRAVESPDGHMPVAAMIAAMDGRTRAVTASTVTFSPGFRTDVQALGEAARRHGALLLLDGVQSVGVLRTDVGGLPVDAMAVSTQKGLLSLYGMGFLYVRREWAERLEPAYLARFGVDLGDAHEASLGDDIVYAAGARRFDLGNYNFPAAAAVDRSLELMLALGPDRIEAHVTALSARLIEGLLDLGLPVMGGAPGPHSSGIVTVGGFGQGQHDSAEDPTMNALYAHLAENDVKLSIRRGVLRFSLHLYNDTDDVAQVVDLAAQWARAHNRVR